jgi:Pvc16 N-terminal domain
MIDDLDRTLEALLRRELPPDLVEQVTISFATPDDQFPPASVTLPAIDLFLYDVRENRDLRSNEWLVERRSDGTSTKQRPPVRVDCSYLITAWASQSSTTPAQDEHRLLGEVMKVLLRHPTIPAEVLQGGLKGQEPPLPTSVLQPGLLQSLGEFWQALGGKPKAALHYSVTIGVEAHKPLDAGPLVRDTMLKFRQVAREG